MSTVASFADATARELRAGSALAEALAAATALVGPVDDPRLGVLVAVGEEVGGELADAFEQVAAAARDDEELRAEVRALTAQSRASAWLLTALPVLSVVGLGMLDPHTVDFLLTDRRGWACVGASAAALAGGWAWMAALMRSV